MNSYPINQELTFYDAESKPLSVRAIALILMEQDGKIRGCRLKFTIDEQVYQFILERSLFNLKSEAIFPSKQVKFLPELPLNLEAELRPDWLMELGWEGKTSGDIVNYLINLDLPADITQSCKFTENWYCLSVKQQQGTEEIGYRTVWDYINLSHINEVTFAGGKLVEALANFVRETSERFSSQLETLNDPQAAPEKSLIQLIDFLEEFGSNNSLKRQSISAVMRQFFNEDNWNYVEVEGESVLQMAFQGDNGRWTCYACAFEESEQFVFYSVFPLSVPPERIPPMVEYLMKVNYGLIVGNFELDFTDGEIRYKTSVDVENEQLTTGIANNLVYTNVLTMDKYLPGITALLNTQLSVDEAIALVETQLENYIEEE